MAQPRRFAARTAIFNAVSLSFGARLLYLYLDDHAREAGRWFMKQNRIAVELGVSRRRVQDWLYELNSSGWIAIEAEPGKSSWYVMGWIGAQPVAHPGDTGRAADCAGGAQPVARVGGMGIAKAMSIQPSTIQVLRSTVCHCGVYFEGAERVRCECGAVHDPAVAQEVEPLEETRRMLFGYVSQCGLPWSEPDDDICARTLAAAGSLITLRARLRFLLLDRRLSPSQSYAWFVKVCVSESRRSA